MRQEVDEPRIASRLVGDGTIMVGAIMPLTGRSQYLGGVIANGLRLADKDVHNQNDVRSRIQITFEDDASNEQTAAELVQSFAARGALAILGPVDSHCAAAAAAAAQRERIALVSPAATGSYLIQPRQNGDDDCECQGVENPYFFRAISSDKQRAQELAEWLRSWHPEGGVLLLHEDTTKSGVGSPNRILYGHSIAIDIDKELGVTYPRKMAGYDNRLDAYDFAAVVRAELDAMMTRSGKRGKSSLSPLQALVILGRSRDTIVLAKEVEKWSARLAIYLVSPGKEDFRRANLRNPIMAITDTIVQNVDHQPLREFKKRYGAEFGSDGEEDAVDRYATYGYDATQIVFLAIQRVHRARKTQGGISSLPIAEARELIREQIERHPGDWKGLISNGAFCNNELQAIGHKQMLENGQWNGIRREFEPEQLEINGDPRESWFERIINRLLHVLTKLNRDVGNHPVVLVATWLTAVAGVLTPIVAAVYWLYTMLAS